MISTWTLACVRNDNENDVSVFSVASRGIMAVSSTLQILLPKFLLFQVLIF